MNRLLISENNLFNARSLIIALLFIIFSGYGNSNAATFDVDSTVDAIDANPGDGICADGPGTCTLRAAIMESNALEGADEIILQGNTYTITIPGGDDLAANGDLDITDDVLIQGQGAMDTTINGNNMTRIFHIINGNRQGQIDVQIFDLKIINGEINDLGGGIRNSSGNLLIERVLVDSNTARRGGGIFNGSLGNITIRHSAVHDNFAANDPQEWGGGIYNLGEMEIINSTVSNNNAEGLGAGIFNDGNLNIMFSTIADNFTFDGITGGIHQPVGGSTTVYASIIADNIGQDCGGTPITSLGFNISTSNCNLNQATDMPNTDPLIDFLQDSGGDTMTHPLVNGSPAIDMVGTEEACFELGIDQRGSVRPRDGDLDKVDECDAGAFEHNPEVDSGEGSEGCSLVSKNSVTTLPLYMFIPALFVLALRLRKNR